jgi:hypothetical protein
MSNNPTNRAKLYHLNKPKNLHQFQPPSNPKSTQKSQPSSSLNRAEINTQKKNHNLCRQHIPKQTFNEYCKQLILPHLIHQFLGIISFTLQIRV